MKIKKLRCLIHLVLLFLSTHLFASGIDVYLKSAYEGDFEFYVKVDRQIIILPGEINIPIVTDSVPTRYLRIWKENKQWQSESFTALELGKFNEYKKWVQNNQLSIGDINTNYNGDDIVVSIGTYHFNIKNYKQSPHVTQDWVGVNSGLINSQFAYPFQQVKATTDPIALDSYVTDIGQAGLMLNIPFSGKNASLTFVDNSFEVNDLNALKHDPKVLVKWDSNLKTIQVDQGDKYVYYFFNTTPWTDYNTGSSNETGTGWDRNPDRNDYLTAIGQCERLKSASIPSCRPIITLDYGRSASEDSQPYLKGWRNDHEQIEHQYNNIGGQPTIVSTKHYGNKDFPSTTVSTYQYELDKLGKPIVLKEQSIPGRNNIRTVTSYVTYGDFRDLAHKIVRFGTLNGKEYKLSDSTIDWLLSSTKTPLQSKIEDNTYGIDGALTKHVVTEKSYDSQDRLEKEVKTTDNNAGEQIEDEVDYEFANDYLVKKTEQRSIVSPAYSNGVSEPLTKVFEYKYDHDHLIEQITHQGDFVTSDTVIQDNRDRVISRVRKVNGILTLTETMSYAGDRISQRCENNSCIDYKYQDKDWGYIEKSYIKGTLFKEIHYDNSGIVLSKTVGDVTRKTEYYDVSDVPSSLSDWLAVCPSDTVFVSYDTLPEKMTCTTTQGTYTVHKGINDRFIIAAELTPDDQTKQSISPHFDGEEGITQTIRTNQETQNVEYSINGETEENSNVLRNLTESYDKWGNVIRKKYDISDLLYEVEDHLGNTIRFTYDVLGNVTSSELNNQPNTKVEYRYDARGLRTDMIDPVKGHWRYHYNANGQLEWQKDANGDTTSFQYDTLNRVILRASPSTTVCYQYPTILPLAEPSSIVQVKGQQSSCSGHQIQYQEKNLFKWPNGWVVQKDITLTDGQTQSTHYEYDANGNPVNEYMTSRLGHHLSLATSFKNGIAYQWSNADSGEIYKTIIDATADQRPTHIKLGNGIDEYRQYDNNQGLLTQLSGTRNGAALYQFDFKYNDAQQLTERTREFYYANNRKTSLTDAYGYDDSGRLSTHTIRQICIDGICKDTNLDSISATDEYHYDTYGNITSKTGVGDYDYDANNPYQLTRIQQENGETRNFTYDKNGNLLSDGIRNFKYENNQLREVSRANNNDVTSVDRDSTRFTYGPDGQQIVRTDKRFDITSSSWITTKTLSIGDYSYSYTENAETGQQEAYGGNGFSVRCTAASCETIYSHTDRLDQQFMSTNSKGEILSQTFTDPFGATHNILLPEMKGLIILSANVSSSSGHTGISGFDLIHMNGRIYDPFIGRFLQADPFIVDVENIGNYNRYSYVNNDPINNIDPSGYFGFHHFFHHLEHQIRHEVKREERQVRHEAKRIEAQTRHEAKRVERQTRHEANRFERRTRHELNRWESDTRHGVKIVGMMVKENPELIVAMAVAAWAGPLVAGYVASMIPGEIAAGIVGGMAGGATSSAIVSITANKGSLKGIEKSILIGAATGGIASGVAHGVMELDSMKSLVGATGFVKDTTSGILKSLGNATARSLVNHTDFTDEFLNSALSNIVNASVHNYLSDDLSLGTQTFIGAVAGGIVTTEIYGGDFSTNFAYGAVNAFIDYSYNALDGNTGFFSMDTIKESANVVMDFIPFIGNAKAAYEGYTGHNLFFHDRELSTFERGLASAAVLGGGVVRVGGRIAHLGVEVVEESGSLGRILSAESNLTKETGAYRDVHGHHIHAKAAFKDHMLYNPRDGFCISNKLMDELNLNHQLMTKYQRQAFKELHLSGRPNTLKEHTQIAVDALIAGGASKEMARALTAQSLDALRKSGVKIPTNIPWYKK